MFNRELFDKAIDKVGVRKSFMAKTWNNARCILLQNKQPARMEGF